MNRSDKINPQHARLFLDDVEDAPYKIGDEVIILDNPEHDETFAVDFSGVKGEVIGLDYRGAVGQVYPEDPLMRVKTHKGTESFWKEEIKLRED